MTIKLNVGDAVTWMSQANGSATKKNGTVARVMAAGESVVGVTIPREWVFRWGGGFPRNHESYLVLVKIGKRKLALYWPRVSALSLAAQSEGEANG